MYKRQTLRAVSNLLRGERGEVTKGTIELRDERIEALSPAQLVKRGVIQVMEGRHCFAHLSIEENLLAGAYTPVSYTHLDVYKRQDWRRHRNLVCLPTGSGLSAVQATGAVRRKDHRLRLTGEQASVIQRKRSVQDLLRCLLYTSRCV